VAAELAQRLPRAATRIHPQAGHAVFFEAAAAFNDDLLAFTASASL
jgi:pimeloyl-ACP methyl ester carboxylesterase